MNRKISKFFLLTTMIFGLAVLISLELQEINQICPKSSDTQSDSSDILDQEVMDELIYFPIAREREPATYRIDFVDSWNWERTFGGNRKHEGCDLMQTPSVRGVLPVISMTDGVIENIGWLKLGGYRIGIRSESQTYYYYAHMNDYSPDIYEGKTVAAGELLGFVGDSGYSKIEGTVGMFPVHLHIGIYRPNALGEDVAINPYPYMELLKEDTYLISLKKE